MDLLTREIQTDKGHRISVSDGKGTQATYPTAATNAEQFQADHLAAARQFVADFRGWPNAHVQLGRKRTGVPGFRVTAYRSAVTPSEEVRVELVGIEIDTETGNLILDLGGQRYELVTTVTLRRRLSEAIERSAHYDPEA